MSSVPILPYDADSSKTSHLPATEMDYGKLLCPKSLRPGQLLLVACENQQCQLSLSVSSSRVAA